MIENKHDLIADLLDNQIRCRRRYVPVEFMGTIGMIRIDEIHLKNLAAVRPYLCGLRTLADRPVDQGISVGQALGIAHIE